MNEGSFDAPGAGRGLKTLRRNGDDSALLKQYRIPETAGVCEASQDQAGAYRPAASNTTRGPEARRAT